MIVEGEAGIGKTTLLRSWAARRAAAGDTILLASCGPLDRSMPLDALLTALAALLRRRGPEAAATLLDADAAILAPLLDTAAGPGQLSQLTGLADSMLGPAVLYAALTRVLRRLTEAGARAGAGSLSRSSTTRTWPAPPWPTCSASRPARTSAWPWSPRYAPARASRCPVPPASS